MDWARWNAAYDRDGSLRDICVSSTSERDWDLFLSLVRSTDHVVRYTRDGDKSVTPSSPAHVLGDKTCAYGLMIDGDGVDFMRHSFMTTDFELDLDPRKVASPRSLEPLLGFIVHLGSHLSKDVIFTEEYSPEYLWLKDSWSNGSIQDVSTG